jgi:hypothetical protein
MGKRTLAYATGLVVATALVIASEATAFAADDPPAKKEVNWSLIYDRKGIEGTPARADNKTDDDDRAQGMEIAPLLGFASNNFGLGAGLRAGYRFKAGPYLGAAFMYQHGLDQIPGDLSMRVGMLYPSAEIGYDFRYESISFRPYAGAGVTWLFANTTGGSSWSDASLVAYPGIAITYHDERNRFFGGVDSRLVVPRIDGADLSDVMSVGVYGVAGIQL